MLTLYDNRGEKPPIVLIMIIFRYIGESLKDREPSKTKPNPIITVTEHTPAPSPDFFNRKVCVWVNITL